jgi:hypothetical protein
MRESPARQRRISQAMTPTDSLIHAALRELAPVSVLVLGGPEPQGLKSWRLQGQAQCSVTVLEALPDGEDPAATLSQRYAAAILIGMDRLPDASARATIAALRDRFCDAVLVVAPAGHWVATDWLALGFEALRPLRTGWPRVSCCTGTTSRAFNPEREWNNPQDWAHPENFRRYRW